MQYLRQDGADPSDSGDPARLPCMGTKDTCGTIAHYPLTPLFWLVLVQPLNAQVKPETLGKVT